MATFSVTPSGLGARLVADEAVRQRRVLAAVVEAAQAGSVVIIKAAPRTPGAGPHLTQTVHVVPRADGAEIRIDAPYAAAVELGSRPHWMPLEPLIDYVRRRAADFGLDPGWEHEIEDVARAIRAKIAIYGTQPTHFVRRSIPRLEEILERKLGEVK